LELKIIEGTNGDVRCWKNCFSKAECNAYFEALSHDITYLQGEIRLFGKTYKKPRLEAFFNASGQSYTYSNVRLEGLPFPTLLQTLKTKVEKRLGQSFNAALVNLYRNGLDSNGWHADNESVLGPNPTIGSVSFGSTRMFILKHNLTKKTIKIPLEDGDILWMGPSIQHQWKHCIPKELAVQEPRINVTFRTLVV
jgi:alkylated DNA repair dioxygenase AlkB